MRHEAHRIEKSVYNNILEEKIERYAEKRQRVREIVSVLRERGIDESEPTVGWASRIEKSFPNVERDFIEPNQQPLSIPYARDIQEFVTFLRSRRSVRVWSKEQPTPSELRILSYNLVEAAKWAPTSGDRQPWRFWVLLEDREKNLLVGLKEEHCTSAPLLIFVGMDKRVYGALGPNESGLYIDAGAAIMQMILAAHSIGYATCWNHLADDLIASRDKNMQIYRKFASEMGVPPYIAPVAVLAVGASDFRPPAPARSSIDSLVAGLRLKDERCVRGDDR